MPEIIDIHIHRKKTGSLFTYDKVYLVPPEYLDKIPRIFGFAVVWPVSLSLLEKLSKLHYSWVKEVPTYRPKPDIEKTEMTDWAAFAEKYQLRSRFAVVPMLTSFSRGRIRPRYLAAKRWKSYYDMSLRHQRQGKKVVLPMAIDAQAFITTPFPAPDDTLSSICQVCPRELLALQGECVPGQDICYKTLNFAVLKESTEDAGVQPVDDNDLPTP
jgi:hypothetical protein